MVDQGRGETRRPGVQSLDSLSGDPGSSPV